MKDEYSHVLSKLTADTSLLKADNKKITQELINSLFLIGRENAKTQQFQQKTTKFFEEIIRDTSFLKEKINKEMTKVLDNKLQSLFEKLKRENQNTWDKAVHHTTTNFAEAGGNLQFVFVVFELFGV